MIIGLIAFFDCLYHNRRLIQSSLYCNLFKKTIKFKIQTKNAFKYYKMYNSEEANQENTKDINKLSLCTFNFCYSNQTCVSAVGVLFISVDTVFSSCVHISFVILPCFAFLSSAFEQITTNIEYTLIVHMYTYTFNE